MIIDLEEKKFLLAQREKERRGSMGPVDKSLAAKEKQIAPKEKRLKTLVRKGARRNAKNQLLKQLFFYHLPVAAAAKIKTVLKEAFLMKQKSLAPSALKLLRTQLHLL